MSTENHVFQDPQPLTIKSYTIALDKDEKSLAVPFCLRFRVAHAKYTWRLFLGAASPNAGSGLAQGDVWVATIPGYENIYIRSESHQWHVWHKTINYGEKRYCKNEKKFLHSYHPWLRDRLLQFNGTDLGWHPRRFFNHHRVTWNTNRAFDHPEYESLDSVAVACYVKAFHLLPRPTLFDRVQPAASTSSFGVPPVTPTARLAQPGQPLLPRPTVPGGVQLAAPSSSYSLQPITVLPGQPGQPPLRGLTFSEVQPAPPTSSSSLPTAPTAARPAPQGQPPAPKPTVPGGVQPAARAPSSTPSLRPTAALPAQPVSSSPAEPPKYEDVIPETRLKRQRSSSSLSYASKERSPSPKRTHLGEKVRDLSDTIREQPPHLSCPRTSPLGTPPMSATLSTPATAAPPPFMAAPPPPALAIPPSSAPASRASPVHAVQPLPVPAVQPSLAPATQPVLVHATATHPLPAPSVQPPPTHPVSPHKPASTAKGVDVPTNRSPSDAGTRSILEGASNKPSPPDPVSIESFLSDLPLSLSHRTAAFTTVGVANMEHLRLLAQLHKCSLDKFLAMLRERGLSFIESLVLRSALHALRQPPSADPQAQAEPTTIEAWLERIGPSMVCHARVFQDLGIDIAHIPVLAQLDAESFQEFENALGTAGLAWIDRFVITAQIRDNGLPDLKPEPLLVA